MVGQGVCDCDLEVQGRSTAASVAWGAEITGNTVSLQERKDILGSWWRDLTECGPLEKGMVNHFSILALRTHEQYEKAK